MVLIVVAVAVVVEVVGAEKSSPVKGKEGEVGSTVFFFVTQFGFYGMFPYMPRRLVLLILVVLDPLDHNVIALWCAG